MQEFFRRFAKSFPCRLFYSKLAATAFKAKIVAYGGAGGIYPGTDHRHAGEAIIAQNKLQMEGGPSDALDYQ